MPTPPYQGIDEERMPEDELRALYESQPRGV